jgi:hypothetical protein
VRNMRISSGAGGGNVASVDKAAESVAGTSDSAGGNVSAGAFMRGGPGVLETVLWQISPLLSGS